MIELAAPPETGRRFFVLDFITSPAKSTWKIVNKFVRANKKRRVTGNKKRCVAGNKKRLAFCFKQG
jgi:hypothetical protein